jgi:hypothetical protein
MKQCIIIALIGILGFTCCKSSISVQDLQPQNAFITKLPHLAPVLEVFPSTGNPVFVEFGIVSDQLLQQPVILPANSNHLDSSQIRTIRNSYYQDANASELQVFFARDVTRNMTRSDGPLKGYISCRITALETPQTGGGLLSIHGVTLGATLVTGIPHSSAQTGLEIEVVIRDAGFNPIKRYWGVAFEKKYSGLYYGYRHADLQRACTLEAFTKAMQSVKTQIAMDVDLLENQLNG